MAAHRCSVLLAAIVSLARACAEPALAAAASLPPSPSDREQAADAPAGYQGSDGRPFALGWSTTTRTPSAAPRYEPFAFAVPDWIKSLRSSLRHGQSAAPSGLTISPVQRGPKTSWAEWDIGGVTWRGEMIEQQAQRRIATKAVTADGTTVHLSVVRGRSSSVSTAASAWGTPVTADSEVIQIPGYSVVEVGYGYRHDDWSVTARGGYGWYGQSLDGVRTHQWIQTLDGTYTVREGFRIEPSLTIQAGHFDLPAVGVRTEYRAPAEDGDISMSLGCSYGYGYSGLMESGGTEARTAIRWQPSTTLWNVQPALRLETIYFRMRDRPRAEASPEELVALLSLQLTGRSSGSWTDAVTGWLPRAAPH